MSSAAYFSEGKVRLNVPEGHAAITLILPTERARTIGEAMQIGQVEGKKTLPRFPAHMTEDDLGVVADVAIDAATAFGRALALMSAIKREWLRQQGIATEPVSDEEITAAKSRRH